jgi:hypothetical protein
MTEEERQRLIVALEQERAGYVLRGLDDRVADVDATLRRLGASVVPRRPPRKAKAQDRLAGKGKTTR